jgi:RNA polymerase sigma-70 factor (ECF subfamily)
VNEAALRERAAALEPAALSEIYDAFSGKIYSYIYHRTGDSTLAEDLTGDVFVRMIEAIQADRTWTSSLQGWLYRIAHNLVVDHFRRQTKRDGPELEERWMAAENPTNSFEGLFYSNQLRTAMRFLTEEQQQVIVLKFAEDLSNAEVADIMGKTEGAIKALQHRGLAALRRVVGEYAEAEV